MIGKVLYSFPELNSTNEFAIELLSKTRPIEGAVIITDHQTAGKGQIGSKWESAKGKNITLSCITYPNFLDLLHQYFLTCIVSLSVRDTIHQIINIDKVKIKWPNDVYIGKMKVCGILIQNSVMSGKIQNSVWGIGMNVNQRSFNSDLNNATSLINEMGYEINLEEVKIKLFSNLSNWYDCLQANQLDWIKEKYIEQLYGIDEEKNFFLVRDKITAKGIIKGIDQRGKLKVQHEERVSVYDIKEIQYQ